MIANHNGERVFLWIPDSIRYHEAYDLLRFPNEKQILDKKGL